MNFAEPKNKNYTAVVVRLENFVDLPNCDNVKAALLFGNSVIVAKGVQAGEIGLFFPVETALSADFLKNNNLYRKPEWGNVDPSKKGYFEEHGRIRAVTFRGHKSEGFWIPLDSLSYLGLPLTEFPVGAEFDYVNDSEICRKYIPRRNKVSNPCAAKGKNKSVKDKLVEGQFSFHIDTAQLGRNMHRITPSTIISISDKWHGTSAIFSNVLIQKRGLAERLLPLFSFGILKEKFPKVFGILERKFPKVNTGLEKVNTGLEKIGSVVVNFLTKIERKIGVVFGADEQPTEYGFTWASRRVIKGVNGEAKKGSIHFYSDDIWSIVGKRIEPLVPKGYTIYGEIVGYMPDGGMIQKGYHYGCQPGSHRFLVYRITSVNADGKVIELSWQAMKEFCEKFGLEFVKEFYFGRADGFLPMAPGQNEAEWQDAFLKAVQDKYVRDEMCPHNNMEVPLEGVIVRVERYSECESYKLKSFLFKKRESDLADSGELDVETAEAEGGDEAVEA